MKSNRNELQNHTGANTMLPSIEEVHSREEDLDLKYTVDNINEHKQEESSSRREEEQRDDWEENNTVATAAGTGTATDNSGRSIVWQYGAAGRTKSFAAIGGRYLGNTEQKQEARRWARRRYERYGQEDGAGIGRSDGDAAQVAEHGGP